MVFRGRQRLFTGRVAQPGGVDQVARDGDLLSKVDGGWREVISHTWVSGAGDVFVVCGDAAQVEVGDVGVGGQAASGVDGVLESRVRREFVDLEESVDGTGDVDVEGVGVGVPCLRSGCCTVHSASLRDALQTD